MADKHLPFLALPGFSPDGVLYAVRTTIALLLAYFVCFAAQIPAASSAGVCVMIVAQPSAGMAFSKAIYRLIGTCVGGVVALALLAAFPQDRTMLLMGFAVWIGVCNFVSTLLRDFRSYGAALSGYTVGIIAIAAIDTPDDGLINTLDRVVAIVVGILAVMVVNSLLRSNRAFDGLVRDLRRSRDQMTALVQDALAGRLEQDDMALVRIAAGVAALQTQAVFAATELPDGLRRANGARFTIAALLGTVSAARAVARTRLPETREPVLSYLAAIGTAIGNGGSPTALVPHAISPAEAVLLERAGDLLTRHREAEAGLRMLVDGVGRLPRVRLGRSYDIPAALLGAVRTVIGIALGSTFLVLAGWPDAELMLVLQAAITALLGTQPNPTKASVAFLVPLLPAAALAAGVDFFALPLASGFVPFALAVGPAAFVLALLSRHLRLAPFGPSALLYFSLLIAPANTQSFDAANFLNTVLLVGVAVTFTMLTFNFILPVSPSRRLYRVAASIVGDFRRTMTNPRRLLDETPAQSKLYDRMAQALTWLGRPTPVRQHLLSDIYRVGEVDLAVRRARTGLIAAADTEPHLAEAIEEARRALASGEAASMLAAAQALLDHPASRFVAAEAPVRKAASGIAGLAWLMVPGCPTMRFLERFAA